jgi:GAF domain-containing protein
MEPIPETLEALSELDPHVDGPTLLDQLTSTADRAKHVAPGLVGVSIASREHDLTFTLIATDAEIRALDAVQYLASGPCVDAIALGQGIATSPEGLINESLWRDFARAGAAVGVNSTLTLPIIRAGKVFATVNLYGHAADTFEGRHEDLAAVFGAWAPGAVANADLTFSTRTAAERAPVHLQETAVIDTATGLLAAQRGLTVLDARRQLDDAARRAGVPVARLAKVVIDLHRDR